METKPWSKLSEDEKNMGVTCIFYQLQIFALSYLQVPQIVTNLVKFTTEPDLIESDENSPRFGLTFLAMLGRGRPDVSRDLCQQYF